MSKSEPTPDAHRVTERQRLTHALNARRKCDRTGISYRGYRFERPDWLRRGGAKAVFRILNRHGTHVDNITPNRFPSPEKATDYIDELIDADPQTMQEWMNHPTARKQSGKPE